MLRSPGLLLLTHNHLSFCF